VPHHLATPRIYTRRTSRRHPSRPGGSPCCYSDTSNVLHPVVRVLLTCRQAGTSAQGVLIQDILVYLHSRGHSSTLRAYDSDCALVYVFGLETGRAASGAGLQLAGSPLVPVSFQSVVLQVEWRNPVVQNSRIETITLSHDRIGLLDQGQTLFKLLEQGVLDAQRGKWNLDFLQLVCPNRAELILPIVNHRVHLFAPSMRTGKVPEKPRP